MSCVGMGGGCPKSRIFVSKNPRTLQKRVGRLDVSENVMIFLVSKGLHQPSTARRDDAMGQWNAPEERHILLFTAIQSLTLPLCFALPFVS